MENRITFREVSEKWFSDYAEQYLKKTTFVRNRQLSRRVYNAMGEVDITQISRATVKDFMNSLLQNGANELNGKPLKYKTRKNYLTYIRDVFNYAVEENIIAESPVRQIKVAPDAYNEKEFKDYYDMGKIKGFLSAVMRDAPILYKCYFMLAVTGGLRRGEIMGLEWRDIDFENQIIRINRAFNYTSATGKYLDSTKTKKSLRSVKLPKGTVNLLSQLRDVNPAASDSELLFGGIHHNTPYKWAKRYCRRNNLQFYGIHGLRHIYASTLILSGVDVATVSACLGHSSITTTLSIYTHAFNEAVVRGCEVIEKAFGDITD